MFETEVIEKMKTQISCSISFFLNHAVYEIMWKEIEQPDRTEMAHAHFALDI
jgi:hypothetical protein